MGYNQNMRKTPLPTSRFVPKKALILLISFGLVFFSVVSPAKADDPVTAARAELAATMKSLEDAKTTLAAAEKELATAKSAAAKVAAELKAAEDALAVVQAEMDALNAEIATNQALLDEIVRTAYKMGVSKEWLMVDVIISSDTDENITSKIELLNHVLDSSNDVLAVLMDKKAQLQVKVEEAQKIQIEIKAKNDEAQKIVADIAVKTKKAKAEADRLQALANEKEAVLRKLVFAGLPTNGNIIGADISYAQHSGGRQIDFIKMYDAGVRFLFMKGSSGGDAANAQAMRWSTIDFPKAREAGILTGIYHVGLISAGSSPSSAAAQGVAQANRAISNMNTLGGYKPGVLPVALDIEGFSLAGGAGTPAAVVSAFVRAFLDTVKSQTGFTPIVYSNLSFLKQYINDPAIANYPLWVANTSDTPTPGTVGSKQTCYATVWTTGACNLNWTIWQYSHTGNGATYGVASTYIDLNRFGKSINELLALAHY